MKKGTLFALILSLAMAVNVFAAELGETGVQALSTITTSPGALSTSEASIDVTLEGTVLTDAPVDVITVLMPTQVYFNVMPDEEEWNKVLSPTINISNMGSSDVRISITKAASEGANLTIRQPEGKEVRLGIAPENQIAEALLSSTYLLRANLNDSTYIDLGLVGHDPLNNVARLKVFGDTASGEWTDGDIFSVRTVFKVTM